MCHLFGGDLGEEEGVFRQVDETDIMAELNGIRIYKSGDYLILPHWRHSVRRTGGKFPLGFTKHSHVVLQEWSK